MRRGEIGFVLTKRMIELEHHFPPKRAVAWRACGPPPAHGFQTGTAQRVRVGESRSNAARQKRDRLLCSCAAIVARIAASAQAGKAVPASAARTVNPGAMEVRTVRIAASPPNRWLRLSRRAAIRPCHRSRRTGSVAPAAIPGAVRIRRLVGFGYIEFVHHCPRAGQRHARVQFQPRGFEIHRI